MNIQVVISKFVFKLLFVVLAGLALLMTLPAVGTAHDISSTSNTPQIEFFSAFQDIPLMPGLEELSEQTVSFDKPQGRIIESVTAMHSVSASKLEVYYEDALPAFGWQEISQNLYQRRNERLSIVFENIDGHRFARFMISPI